MKNYIDKPLSTSRNNLFKRKSLSPYSYRRIKYKNNNMKFLKELLQDNKKGHEPGSHNYIKVSNNYFIRIGDMSDNNFTITQNEQTLKIRLPSATKATLTKGDICYQTASNVGNVCFYNGRNAYYNSHIRKLSFKEDKFYIFAMLKSSFCRNQVDIGGSIKGVDNFSKNYLLNTLVPYPTIKNNNNPKEIERLVSILTQNITDKEEQIRFKNNLINEEIEKELVENQKIKIQKYNYPKISELKNKTRLDTGLYETNYKTNNSLIENYRNGYFTIPIENFKSGSTPRVRIFNGKKFNYKWVTPTNIEDYGFYRPVEEISMPSSFNLKKDAILFINRTSKGKKGEYVGISCFYDYDYYNKGQHNQGIYRVEEFSKSQKLFIVAFMNSKIIRKICGNISIGSKMKEMKSYDFEKLIFPKFSDNKKNSISKHYYNKIEKLSNVTIDNYLKIHKTRNKKLGIFQLNIDLFELKETLENLIHSIVMNESIEIDKYIR